MNQVPQNDGMLIARAQRGVAGQQLRDRGDARTALPAELEQALREWAEALERGGAVVATA